MVVTDKGDGKLMETGRGGESNGNCGGGDGDGSRWRLVLLVMDDGWVLQEVLIVVVVVIVMFLLKMVVILEVVWVLKAGSTEG